MALEPNVIQPNSVVKFGGNNVTVVQTVGNVVTLGNHEDGIVSQVYLDYLLEHGEPVETDTPAVTQSTQPSETLAQENAELEPTNPTGYDPVTGRPNPAAPSGVTPSTSPSGPTPSTDNPVSSSAPDSPRANPGA